MQNFSDSYLKYLKIEYITAYVTFNAILYQYVYYREYHINIYDIFEISQVISTVFLTIPKILLKVCFAISFFVSLEMISKKIFKKKKIEKPAIEKENNETYSNLDFVAFYCLQIVIVFMAINMDKPSWHSDLWYLVDLFTKMLMIFFFGFVVVRILLKEDFSYKHPFVIVSYLVATCSMIAVFAKFDAIYDRMPFSPNQISFKYNNQIIESGTKKKYYFVGMSTDFIILFDQKKSESILIKKEKLDSIIFFKEGLLRNR